MNTNLSKFKQATKQRLQAAGKSLTQRDLAQVFATKTSYDEIKKAGMLVSIFDPTKFVTDVKMTLGGKKEVSLYAAL